MTTTVQRAYGIMRRKKVPMSVADIAKSLRIDHVKAARAVRALVEREVAANINVGVGRNGVYNLVRSLKREKSEVRVEKVSWVMPECYLEKIWSDPAFAAPVHREIPYYRGEQI